MTGTLRSHERPKVKSSLLSLSIVAELDEGIEEIQVKKVRVRQESLLNLVSFIIIHDTAKDHTHGVGARSLVRSRG